MIEQRLMTDKEKECIFPSISPPNNLTYNNLIGACVLLQIYATITCTRCSILSEISEIFLLSVLGSHVMYIIKLS